jgi:hypothetical protein
MFEDDTSDADGADGATAPAWSGPVPVGDTGWLAGDFKNGLGLFGMVPPPGYRPAPSADRRTLFGLGPPPRPGNGAAGSRALRGGLLGDFQDRPGLVGPPSPRKSGAQAPTVNATSPVAFSTNDAGDPALTVNESGNSKKEECHELCSHLALPSRDFGVRFWRCVNQCMGTNSYPEWEGHF